MVQQMFPKPENTVIHLNVYYVTSHRHQTQQQFETKTLQTLGAISAKEAVQSLHQVLQGGDTNT